MTFDIHRSQLCSIVALLCALGLFGLWFLGLCILHSLLLFHLIFARFPCACVAPRGHRHYATLYHTLGTHVTVHSLPVSLSQGNYCYFPCSMQMHIIAERDKCMLPGTGFPRDLDTERGAIGFWASTQLFVALSATQPATVVNHFSSNLLMLIFASISSLE